MQGGGGGWGGVRWCPGGRLARLPQYFGEILQLRSDQKVLADAKDKYKAMVLRLEDKLLEAERKLCCFDSPRSMHQSFNSSPRTPRQQ